MNETTIMNIQRTPMKPWLYTTLFIPGALVASIIFGNSTAPIRLPVILSILAVSLFVYSAWKTLDAGPGRPGPLLASILLFVPILNLIWLYKAVYPLGRCIKMDAEKYGIKIDDIDAFSRVYCHLQIISLPIAVFAFVFWGMRMPNSSTMQYIPVFLAVGTVVLLWLAVIHIMFFHYSRIINDIAKARNT